MDSLINGVKVAKAESVKKSVKWNTILVNFEKEVCALQALANANVGRNVKLMDSVAKI